MFPSRFWLANHRPDSCPMSKLRFETEFEICIFSLQLSNPMLIQLSLFQISNFLVQPELPSSISDCIVSDLICIECKQDTSRWIQFDLAVSYKTKSIRVAFWFVRASEWGRKDLLIRGVRHWSRIDGCLDFVQYDGFFGSMACWPSQGVWCKCCVCNVICLWAGTKVGTSTFFY